MVDGGRKPDNKATGEWRMRESRAYPLLEPSNPDLPDAPQTDLTPDIVISESFT